MGRRAEIGAAVGVRRIHRSQGRRALVAEVIGHARAAADHGHPVADQSHRDQRLIGRRGRAFPGEGSSPSGCTTQLDDPVAFETHAEDISDVAVPGGRQRVARGEDGGLDEVAVVKHERAGDGEAVEPALRGDGGVVVLLRHAHPAEHDRRGGGAGAREDLRGVELEAVVELGEGRGDVERAALETTDQVSALVAVAQRVAGGRADALGREDEDVGLLARGGVGHAQQIRALPHVAAGGGAVDEQLAARVPRAAVVGKVEQSGAAIVVGAGAEEHPPPARPVGVFGDDGIAAVRGEPRRRARDQRIARVLGGDAEGSVGEHLGQRQILRRAPHVADGHATGELGGEASSAVSALELRGHGQVAGVEQLDGVAGRLRGDRAAGETPVGVVRVIGEQGPRAVRPRQQVLRRRVAPAGAPRLRGETRVELEEHVPEPAQPDQPVGVVEPSALGREVECRPVPVCAVISARATRAARSRDPRHA